MGTKQTKLALLLWCLLGDILYYWRLSTIIVLVNSEFTNISNTSTAIPMSGQLWFLFYFSGEGRCPVKENVLRPIQCPLLYF